MTTQTAARPTLNTLLPAHALIARKAVQTLLLLLGLSVTFLQLLIAVTTPTSLAVLAFAFVPVLLGVAGATVIATGTTRLTTTAQRAIARDLADVYGLTTAPETLPTTAGAAHLIRLTDTSLAYATFPDRNSPVLLTEVGPLVPVQHEALTAAA